MVEGQAVGLQQQQPMPVEVERVIRVEQARAPNPGVFNGDPGDWPNFRSRFYAEVQSRQFDNATKLMFLLSACVGSAKISMGDWELTNENYEKAWQVLEEKYEDKFRLEQALVMKLLKTEKESKETHVALRNVIDKTNNTLRQLEAIGTNIDGWDPIIIGLVMAAIPRCTADAWEQHRDVNKRPGLKQLMSFLEQRAKGRVFIEAASVETPTSQPRPRAAFHFQRRPFNSKPGYEKYERKEMKTERLLPVTTPSPADATAKGVCVCCGGPHPLFRCPKFIEKTVEKRTEEVKQLNVCGVCLRRHAKGECKSQGACNQCDGRSHNYLLCKRRENGAKQGDSKRSREQAFGRP